MNESQQSNIFQVKFRQCKHYGNFTIRKIITSAFWKVLLFQPQGLESYQLLFFMKFVVAIEVERRCKLADSSLLFRAFLSLAFRFSTFTFFLSVHADYHNCKICRKGILTQILSFPQIIRFLFSKNSLKKYVRKNCSQFLSTNMRTHDMFTRILNGNFHNSSNDLASSCWAILFSDVLFIAL